MMRRARYGAGIFLVAGLVGCCPALAAPEIIQTISDPTIGISVMVPDGYLAQLEVVGPKKENLNIKLTSKDSIGSYCDLSFARTTVPDKWWHDKTKRDWNEGLRTQEVTEASGRCIPDPSIRNCGGYSMLNGQIIGIDPRASVQIRSLQLRLRALFTYVSVKCSTEAKEYDNRRPVFEAVIRSIKVLH